MVPERIVLTGIASLSLIRDTSFEIVHRLKKAKTLVDVYTEMHSAADVFGYDTFMIGQLPISHRDELIDCSYIAGWPPGWTERYDQRHYVHSDPVVRRASLSSDPFCWAQAAEEDRSAKAAVVMNEATEFGLNEGHCIPIHEINGLLGGASFGSRRKFIEDEDSKTGLHLVSIFAMSQIREINRKSITGERYSEPEAGLSGREIECLKWASIGKTSWETSVVLNLSARTVERHLASATRKLNSSNVVQSVANAIRRKIIE